ncbi:hypothetical protein NL676_034221 [Syzygium grande]|nr:hypothetical protein NL676_034221 [Syzygium grande]
MHSAEWRRLSLTSAVGDNEGPGGGDKDNLQLGGAWKCKDRVSPNCTTSTGASNRDPKGRTDSLVAKKRPKNMAWCDDDVIRADV